VEGPPGAVGEGALSRKAVVWSGRPAGDPRRSPSRCHQDPTLSFSRPSSGPRMAEERSAREDFTNGSRRWDVIVDTAGRRPLSQLRRALAAKGTLVIVGGDGGGPWTGGFFRGMLRGPLVSLFVGQRLRGLISKEKQEDLQTLIDPDRDRQGHAGDRQNLPVDRSSRRDPVSRGRPPQRQGRRYGVKSAGVTGRLTGWVRESE
jgi:hypothetical protein